MSLIYLFFLVIFIIFLNKFLIKKNILLSETGDHHQKFASLSKVPLSGGIFIFLGFCYFINENIYSFLLFSSAVLILGIFSDLKLIKSASIRFLFQILIVFSFIVFNEIQINDTRIFLLDKILSNNIINYAFVTFCILVVINGSNFIDGMNTLASGYYLLVLTIIFYLNLNQNIIIEEISINYILLLLSIIFILNIFNKIFLGDAGSYLLGFSFGIFLIDTYNLNEGISPFFIILLLWYPCYENLFSILRKFNFKKSPLLADKNHLHQLIFLFFKKKYRLNNLYSNNLTTFFITFFNFLIFILASMSPTKSEVQVAYIFLGVFLYTISYIKLLQLKAKKYI